ncbi:MAG: phosphoglycerate dehydrogenase [Phototrophicaceae bacterium]
MKWNIMVSAPYMQPHIERLRPLFTAHDAEIILPPVRERMEEAQLLDWVGEIDGTICGDDRFTARVLDAAPRLKVIHKWGTGIDSIDQVACHARGVRVLNTPNAFSEPVADSVYGYMLAFARNIPFMDRHMKRHQWEKINGRALNESTLGVIGVGNVGKAVIRRALGFGLRVVATDIAPIDPSFVAQYGVELTTLEEVLRQSDFVTVHCDLNPTSHHLMSDAQFALMPKHAVLINTARGPVVDEPALVRALQSGQLAGAGLDVFEDEPLPHTSPLLGMEQVLLAPHNSNSSPKAWEHVHQNSIRQLFDALEGIA